MTAHLTLKGYRQSVHHLFLLIREPQMDFSQIALVIALSFLGVAVVAFFVSESRRSRLAERNVLLESKTIEEAQTATNLAQAELDLSKQANRGAALEAELKGTQARVAELRDELKLARDECRVIAQERDALARSFERQQAQTEALEGRIRDLNDAKDKMRLEFGETAGALLKEHSENFKSQNSEQIGHLLAPLKIDIDAFKQSLGEAHTKSIEQHVSLKEQIEQLNKQSVVMSKETENLTRALKGNVQMQGAWGQMILETILQRSGLREGEEYTREESHTAVDGSRVRTDVIVNLPDSERIIIDAKVSLKNFEAFIRADTDDDRAMYLAAHTASVKSHIKSLAGKEYHSKVGSKLDFVIMFMPIEAALGAAFQYDGELGFFAADSKVAIATPTTLTVALKTIAAIWRIERQNRNAEEIAKRAGVLYDKFVGFVGDMKAVGTRMRQLENAYQDAFKKLTSGTGNLVRQADMLKELGAATNKSLSADLLDEPSPVRLALVETTVEGPPSNGTS